MLTTIDAVAVFLGSPHTVDNGVDTRSATVGPAAPFSARVGRVAAQQ